MVASSHATGNLVGASATATGGSRALFTTDTTAAIATKRSGAVSATGEPFAFTDQRHIATDRSQRAAPSRKRPGMPAGNSDYKSTGKAAWQSQAVPSLHGGVLMGTPGPTSPTTGRRALASPCAQTSWEGVHAAGREPTCNDVAPPMVRLLASPKEMRGHHVVLAEKRGRQVHTDINARPTLVETAPDPPSGRRLGGAATRSRTDDEKRRGLQMVKQATGRSKSEGRRMCAPSYSTGAHTQVLLSGRGGGAVAPAVPCDDARPTPPWDDGVVEPPRPQNGLPRGTGEFSPRRQKGGGGAATSPYFTEIDSAAPLRGDPSKCPGEFSPRAVCASGVRDLADSSHSPTVHDPLRAGVPSGMPSRSGRRGAGSPQQYSHSPDVSNPDGGRRLFDFHSPPDHPPPPDAAELLSPDAPMSHALPTPEAAGVTRSPPAEAPGPLGTAAPCAPPPVFGRSSAALPRHNDGLLPACVSPTGLMRAQTGMRAPVGTPKNTRTASGVSGGRVGAAAPTTPLAIERVATAGSLGTSFTRLSSGVTVAGGAAQSTHVVEPPVLSPVPLPSGEVAGNDAFQHLIPCFVVSVAAVVDWQERLVHLHVPLNRRPIDLLEFADHIRGFLLNELMLEARAARGANLLDRADAATLAQDQQMGRILVQSPKWNDPTEWKDLTGLAQVEDGAVYFILNKYRGVLQNSRLPPPAESKQFKSVPRFMNIALRTHGHVNPHLDTYVGVDDAARPWVPALAKMGGGGDPATPLISPELLQEIGDVDAADEAYEREKAAERDVAARKAAEAVRVRRAKDVLARLAEYHRYVQHQVATYVPDLGVVEDLVDGVNCQSERALSRLDDVNSALATMAEWSETLHFTKPNPLHTPYDYPSAGDRAVSPSYPGASPDRSWTPQSAQSAGAYSAAAGVPNPWVCYEPAIVAVVKGVLSDDVKVAGSLAGSPPRATARMAQKAAGKSPLPRTPLKTTPSRGVRVQKGGKRAPAASPQVKKKEGRARQGAAAKGGVSFRDVYDTHQSLVARRDAIQEHLQDLAHAADATQGLVEQHRRQGRRHYQHFDPHYTTPAAHTPPHPGSAGSYPNTPVPPPESALSPASVSVKEALLKLSVVSSLHGGGASAQKKDVSPYATGSSSDASADSYVDPNTRARANGIFGSSDEHGA